MVCSFFGHRETPSEIYPQLKDRMEALIQERKINSFLVGNQGGFDGLVLKALRELKQKYQLLSHLESALMLLTLSSLSPTN